MSSHPPSPHPLPSSDMEIRPKPIITLLPVQPEDFPVLARLESLVFVNDPFSITAFGPQKDSAENLALRVKGLERASCSREGRWMRGVKAVAGDGGEGCGEIVGWCAWSFFMVGESEGKGKGEGGGGVVESESEGDGNEDEEMGWGISANIKFCEDVFLKSDMWMLESTKGQSYAKLNSLIVHPAYQCLGIGTQMLQQGLQEVDRLHLQCVLGASPEGKGLYERAGFTEVNRMQLDLEGYVNGKGLGTTTHAVMWRAGRA